eukprot:gnl/TRDRNA2_/TRDRNA2_170268_c1_seq1.p1 gnl/TRDRNA2_/TRDRNA2_170268_c1~~gnl/TRDRNA2_/TRDRNA2_170268_c1_seq1.p1  ORF type:complete len:183 (-),score=22.02 gnl/TRDRNA2_/TRDRNA2_170268_c1_seq1:463-1011(-)
MGAGCVRPPNASAPDGGASCVMGGVLQSDTESCEGMCLLIIDPQNDFHPPNGSLQVAGALEDTDRIMTLLNKNASQISRIVVTLDTHHKMHIANPCFWVGEDGKSPNPFTIITAEDIKAGKWKASQSDMSSWALEYATKLESAGRFDICVWPEYCLLGSAGHAGKNSWLTNLTSGQPNVDAQ